MTSVPRPRFLTDGFRDVMYDILVRNKVNGRYTIALRSFGLPGGREMLPLALFRLIDSNNKVHKVAINFLHPQLRAISEIDQQRIATLYSFSKDLPKEFYVDGFGVFVFREEIPGALVYNRTKKDNYGCPVMEIE